jgi:hypothetical protein
MDNSILRAHGADENLSAWKATGRARRRSPGSFAVMGPLLQRPMHFFREIREGIDLPEKIAALFVSSSVFLTLYGAVLGSGHTLLSLNLAIAVPFLFLTCIVICMPVMYLFDVLTGSQRSLAQLIAVLFSSLGASSTVFFSFTPLILAFSLAGTLLHFFWLNLGVLALATLVGLVYVIQGNVQTAIVDTSHGLSKLNRWLHLFWAPLFLVALGQMTWKLVLSYQENGGPLMMLIWLLMG